MTTEEILRRTGIPLRTLRRWIAQGCFGKHTPQREPTGPYGGRRLRWSPEALELALELRHRSLRRPNPNPHHR